MEGKQNPDQFSPPHLTHSYPPSYPVVVPIQPDKIEPMLKHPVTQFCPKCNKQVVTQVRSSVSSGGWAWFCCCCLCGGGWLPGLLGCCLPGFKEHEHTCPHCRNFFGVYHPEKTAGEIILMVLVSLLSLAAVAFIVYVNLQR
eukprot:GFUD01033248.1.p1 GENE.GFUD01033248.1~~GFUD01033248.1.p1  ORF type:complete len:142 (-),score=13.93 GFUD01033248.1:1268-1693(-)